MLRLNFDRVTLLADRVRLPDDGGIDFSALTKVEVGFMSQALSGQAVAVSTAGARRTLKPLPGWPPKPFPPRPRPSVDSGYGCGRSAGRVAPVGVELL